MDNAKLILDDKEHDFSVEVGTEGEVAIDTRRLRKETGAITFDPGFGSTGSCKSAITFIDGEKGILRHRGYPIEELAEKVSFEEVIHLVIWGELPTRQQLESLRGQIDEKAALPESVKKVIESLPTSTHPMAVAQAATAALYATAGEVGGDADHDAHIVSLIAKFKALAAAIYRHQKGQPFIAPTAGTSYAADFLTMMYGGDGADEVIEEAIDKLLILHADHEQNCSASTVRMVGSSQANLYASISAGIGALWGPLHGGANQRVLEMLEKIQNDGGDVEKYVNLAKDKESGFRLMGFGHRVYKNYDPRAKILKRSTDRVLQSLGKKDPLLDTAKKLEEAALEDDYFVSRKLFPNVDFYSGIIYRALGIPTNMFTVMFALGRLPGWIGQWKELRDDTTSRIWRPRQVYIGENRREVPSLEQRG